MSKEEIKYEINQVLNHLPDETLEEILRFLKQVQTEKSTSMFNTVAIQKLFSEDKELLEKLAQ